MSSQKQADANLQTAEQIRKLEKMILSSNENLNHIVAILKVLETGQDEAIFHSMKSLQRIFIHFIDSGDIVPHLAPAGGSKKQEPSDALSSVKQWLRKRYFSYIHSLLRLLHNEEPGLQIPALEALMAIVVKASETFCGAEHLSKTFVNILFPSVIMHLVINDRFNEKLLDSWRQQYLLKFDDVRFFTLINIRRLLENRRSGGKLADDFSFGSENLENVPTDILATNIFQIIQDLRMPTLPAELDSFIAGVPDKSKMKKPDATPKGRRGSRESTPKVTKSGRKLADLAEHRKVFTKCWLEFLKLPLPTTLYKQVLTNFHEMVLPHLTTPVLLMDFLSSSYDVGGVISLLSLNGLFLLMHKHNLDYPDFYPKLYGLLRPDIFYVKYRARFFKLAHIFLSSTHLPTYLVCAFAKRLARLALFAPPPVVMAILPLVYNIMVMHPAAQVLLHRAPKHDPTNQVLMLKLDVDEIIRVDPFKFDEMDPAKCQAADSSLWEVQALSNHYVPSVSTMAKIFDIQGEMRKQQYKLEDEVVEQSYQSMLQFELKRRNKHGFPLAFSKPTEFFVADGTSFDGFIHEDTPKTPTETEESQPEPRRIQKSGKRKRQE